MLAALAMLSTIAFDGLALIANALEVASQSAFLSDTVTDGYRD
jgi:hypothetical protein